MKQQARIRLSSTSLLCLLALATLATLPVSSETSAATQSESVPRIRHALFVVADGVFNSELMAPYDVFQHTVFRDGNDYMETAIVSEDGQPVTTFEGIVVEAHYSFETAPRPDILVIPSTAGSLDRDLKDKAYMGWIKKAVAQAEWVVTVCDGAFPLAATGSLDGLIATTYPGDREEMAKRFPKVDVRHDVRLVVDGKYLTSVGGGMSYEPAFWLVEHLYGVEHVQATARGLVWPWDSESLPHLVVDRSAD